VCYVRVADNVYRGFTEDNNGVIELRLEKCYRVR
jgi:hypothetical protein